jgi:hypothetical protein
MGHYQEDELILYYYGEGRKRPDIERHLDECGACAAAYREIAGTLAMVVEPPLPERGDQYGLEVWQRIRHKLPEQELPWWSLWFRGERLMLVAAAAVLVLAAFVAGRYLPREQAGSVPPRSRADCRGQQFRRASAHSPQLGRGSPRSIPRVLTDVMNTSESRDISTEQRWAEDLLTTSRLYRHDAEDAGEQSVASVLDDLERSLLEIVHSPSQISAADLEQIRRRIDAAALLFKVRVLSDDLRQRRARPRTPPRRGHQPGKSANSHDPLLLLLNDTQLPVDDDLRGAGGRIGGRPAHRLRTGRRRSGRSRTDGIGGIGPGPHMMRLGRSIQTQSERGRGPVRWRR